MAKPKYNEIDKECPICGGLIWGRGQRVLLEGAKITVCDNCAQHGVKIRKPPASHQINKTYQRRSAITPKKQNMKSQKVEALEIISNYANKIKTVRNSLGLNQDQFAQKLNEKPSLIRRIEAGRVEPTIKLAKKIQEVYKIKLLKTTDETEFSVQDTKFMKKSTGSSLGDIAFIKKKSKD
ncbi:MAG: multiprotein bridging factor aMBF1 [Promethearchaeota archaeon]|jgi:putative transcription factor